MQEAALDKTISVGASEETLSSVSMPSKHMLTWAQQIAQAAQHDSASSMASRAQSQGTPSDLPADSLQAREQHEEPSGAHASTQGSQGTSAGDRDPFAYDGSAFGMGASERDVPVPSEPEQAAAPASSQADPFAFDMGAFGMASEPEPPLLAASQPQDPTPVTAASAAAPEQAPAAAQDPYAFDMGAFGMGAMSTAPADEEARSSAPARAANDPGSKAEAAQDSGPAKAATHADPYAFDMGAFGMAAHPPQEPVDSSLQAQASEAQHPSSAVHQHESAAAPAAPADPFAFNMGAFGMSGMTAAEETAEPVNRGKDQSSAVRPAEPAPEAAADPFAFDLGAFGISLPGATEQGADSRSAASLVAAQCSQQDTPMSSQPTATPAKSSGQAEGRSSSAMQQAQRQQQQATASQAAAGGLALALPEQEAFEPLTDVELQQLERLLLRAAGLHNGDSANGESALPCLSDANLPFVLISHSPVTLSPAHFRIASALLFVVIEVRCRKSFKGVPGYSKICKTQCDAYNV